MPPIVQNVFNHVHIEKDEMLTSYDLEAGNSCVFLCQKNILKYLIDLSTTTAALFRGTGGLLTREYLSLQVLTTYFTSMIYEFVV